VVVEDTPEGGESGKRRGLRLPQAVPEPLSPLVAIVPGQLLAAHLAEARGYDPDKPRGLNKVTKTL
jgi:glucosamine--fructose-6-phosphate aminotransferase (isomerizing)